jgi:quinol-cytochrome oxidoreductase complex cytochrome b subunit
LSISSFAIQDLTKIASLINGIVYLIGIGEGAIKIILPTFKDFYAEYDSSYAELLTAFFIIICILNVVLSWLGIETPMDLQTVENMSMVAFIVMGLLGFYYLRFISKRRS